MWSDGACFTCSVKGITCGAVVMYGQVAQFCPQRKQPGGKWLVEITGSCALTKRSRRLELTELTVHELTVPNPTRDVTVCESWPHQRGLRPLLFSNSVVGSFTSHKNQVSVSAVRWQGRNMVYGLRAQSPKYAWDRGSEERAQGSEEWHQGSQGFWARIRDQIYYTV